MYLCTQKSYPRYKLMSNGAKLWKPYSRDLHRSKDITYWKIVPYQTIFGCWWHHHQSSQINFRLLFAYNNFSILQSVTISYICPRLRLPPLVKIQVSFLWFCPHLSASLTCRYQILRLGQTNKICLPLGLFASSTSS